MPRRRAPSAGAARRTLWSAGAPVVGQTAEPAFQSAQDMFQPLRPLSGWISLSGEPFTTTTSPMREFL